MKCFLLVCIMILLIGAVASFAVATTIPEITILGGICGVLGWMFGSVLGGR